MEVRYHLTLLREFAIKQVEVLPSSPLYPCKLSSCLVEGLSVWLNFGVPHCTACCLNTRSVSSSAHRRAIHGVGVPLLEREILPESQPQRAQNQPQIASDGLSDVNITLTAKEIAEFDGCFLPESTRAASSAAAPKPSAVQPLRVRVKVRVIRLRQSLGLVSLLRKLGQIPPLNF